uniref:Uncharacterized protein n=1 Tax=Strigamia maritima TaxID=126957 RepID=T1IYP5_STRMM
MAVVIGYTIKRQMRADVTIPCDHVTRDVFTLIKTLFNTKIKIKGQDRNFCANDCNHDNVYYGLNEDRINIRHVKLFTVLSTIEDVISVWSTKQKLLTGNSFHSIYGHKGPYGRNIKSIVYQSQRMYVAKA